MYYFSFFFGFLFKNKTNLAVVATGRGWFPGEKEFRHVVVHTHTYTPTHRGGCAFGARTHVRARICNVAHVHQLQLTFYLSRLPIKREPLDFFSPPAQSTLQSLRSWILRVHTYYIVYNIYLQTVYTCILTYICHSLARTTMNARRLSQVIFFSPGIFTQSTASAWHSFGNVLRKSF